jgi:hypothetical protein
VNRPTNFAAMFALAVAASVSVSQDARAQPVNEVETAQGPALNQGGDASADNAAEMEKFRALQAEYERLRVEHDRLQAEVAALVVEARVRRFR